MKMGLIIVAVLAAVILALLFIPLRLELVYEKNSEKNSASAVLKYMFFKFRIYPDEKNNKNKKSKKKKKQEKPEKEQFSFERAKNRIEAYISIFESVKSDAADILRYGARHAVVFEKISVNTEFGFENAMHTGIFTGILNGFVYSVLGLIHQNSTLKDMNVKIQPVFGNTCFNSRLECIVRIKNVHIIVIAAKVLKLLNKIKKEGSR